MLDGLPLLIDPEGFLLESVRSPCQIRHDDSVQSLSSPVLAKTQACDVTQDRAQSRPDWQIRGIYGLDWRRQKACRMLVHCTRHLLLWLEEGLRQTV